MCGCRKLRQGGPDNVFSYELIPQRAVRTPLKKQMDPLGPIASQGRSIPVFLRKPLATCKV